MEKQRIYLTPAEVQEFIALGVDFGETADVYKRTEWGAGEVDNWVRCRNVDLGLNGLIAYQEIPAPSLQEVIAVMPKSINRNGTTLYFELHCKTIAGDDTYFARYRRVVFDRVRGEQIVEINEMDFNPLVAVVDLFRWVCANYPETLKTDDNKG